MGNFIKPNILLIPVFLLMIFLGRKICQMDFPITDFTNITLSLATLRNVDISKAALWYLVYVLPLCFLFAWLFNKSALYDFYAT